jgi:hypothetical protein
MKAIVVVALAIVACAGSAVAQTPKESQGPTEAPAPPNTAERRDWNVWMEGRLFGINDRVGAQNSIGKYVMVGADNKPVDWLTLGAGISYENFDTKSGPTNLPTTSHGVGFNPYVVARATPNLYLSLFGGITHVDYNTALAPGVTAQFDAWRPMIGTAVIGVWREGQLRIQPTASIVYGAENQRAYTTSQGVYIGPQSIEFGRITVGPEFGYAFSDATKSWTFEPFINVRGNFDYIPGQGAVFNGATFVGGNRGQWSAAVAVGAALNTQKGAFLRLQASHESIGMNGLDIWLGSVRGGWNF